MEATLKDPNCKPHYSSYCENQEEVTAQEEYSPDGTLNKEEFGESGETEIYGAEEDECEEGEEVEHHRDSGRYQEEEDEGEDWGDNDDYGGNQYCEYCVEKDKVIKRLEEKVSFDKQTLTDKNKRISHLQQVVNCLNNGEYTPRCMQGKETYDQLNEKLEQKLGIIAELKCEISVLKNNESKANFSQLKTNWLLRQEKEELKMHLYNLELIKKRLILKISNANEQIKNLTQLNQQLSDQVDKVTEESKEFQELCHAKTVLLSSLKKPALPSKPVMVDGKYDYKELFTQIILRLDQSLECPISFAPITSPAICPSGKTIDKSVFIKLSQGDKRDPFTNTDLLGDLVVNRYMTEIMSIIEEFKTKSNFSI
ncbi:unnamed protein product [Moneuplotes crassus]|uniref:U-box domain-containing protein n=1 Tax=Euplotes crassus TaxID=5936 RepID=A0AAD1UNU0_EUPCR|nr:unnamed protein product [Moneuplotes crassus]